MALLLLPQETLGATTMATYAAAFTGYALDLAIYTTKRSWPLLRLLLDPFPYSLCVILLSFPLFPKLFYLGSTTI